VGLFKRVDLAGFAFAPGERALIRAEIVGGSALATTEALHLLLENSERIEWWQVKHASFDPQTQSLRLTTEKLVVEIHLAAPSMIAEVIRERVTATILTSTSYVTPNQARAVISLRRRPVGNRDENFIEIDWQGSPSPSAMAEAQRRGRALLEQSSF
jgi:hypothetical protein